MWLIFFQKCNNYCSWHLFYCKCKNNFVIWSVSSYLWWLLYFHMPAGINWSLLNFRDCLIIYPIICSNFLHFSPWCVIVNGVISLFKSSAENTLSSNFLQLALYVLSFLEPRDLLQAAQTCRYWRILAEDNLLWREKCKEEGKAVQNVGCNGQSVAIIKSAVHLHNKLKVLQRQFIWL